MIQTHKPSSAFGKWLMKYRMIIIIASFFILVPIVFVVSLYLGDYLRNKDVNFGDIRAKNIKDSTLVIEESTSHEVITLDSNDLTVSIKLKSILKPEYIDEVGNYKFKVKYATKNNKSISNLSVSLVLHTQWIDTTSDVKAVNPSTSYGSDQSITYSHILPRTPLPFVTITSPDLYVMVTYQVESVLGSMETYTTFYKVNLKGLTPSDVIDANK